MSALHCARTGLRKLIQLERFASQVSKSHFVTSSSSRFLSTSVTKNPSSSSTKEKEKPKEQMDQLKSNPYFAKYESKLKAVYNQDPDSFLTALKNYKPEKAGDGIPGLELQSKMADSLAKKRTLDSIMKTELLTDHKADEIKNIWTTYMHAKSRLADLLTVEQFERLKGRSKDYCTFLFALPRQEGYEFIMAQWSSKNEWHFTPLINYQAHGENAPSIMSAIYFDDLIDSKQCALEMVEMDANCLKKEEAKFLMDQLRRYYMLSNFDDEQDSKFSLIHCFNKTPANFKHMSIIDELKKDGVTVDQFKEPATESAKAEESK